ncbi:MAG: N-acetylmuramoyl-L-alanine amidase [Lachnospiraceae bacterium]|nr:N-acetylmuramoyl-L-alanine amidase [Lachnospiraceae bacterium]
MRNRISFIIALIAATLLLGCGSGVSEDNSLGTAEPVSAPVAIPVIKVESVPQEEPASSLIQEPEVTQESEEEAAEEPDQKYPPGYSEDVEFDPSWEYADYTVINSGSAKLYRASDNRNDVIIGVNAGHGTKGGESKKTYCHPDKTPKVTGGTTQAGAVKAPAVSGGMRFADGTTEAAVTLRMAELLRDELLAEGFDVLLVRDEADEQFDNIARTVICNNVADCMISLHWDGDGLTYDKGCFYVSVPDPIKDMEPVATYWQQHDRLGQALIDGLAQSGYKINGNGHMAIDLTQMSYSTVPSVDIELGNAASPHDDATLAGMASAMVPGIREVFGLVGQ